MSVVLVGKIIEITENPFGKGDLTSDGVQWSDEATSTGIAYEDVESITLDQIGGKGGPGANGTLIEVEFGITLQQKNSSGSYKAVGRIQGRNKDGTWVTIMSEKTNVSNGTSYEEWTYSGRFETETDFNKYPFDIKVQVKSNNSSGNGIAQVQNSSYIKLIYKISSS